jgi:hypothetical protein
MVKCFVVIAKLLKSPFSSTPSLWTCSDLRYDRAPTILVAQEVMAAFDAENGKTGLSEGGNKVGTGDAGAPAHAAMVTR